MSEESILNTIKILRHEIESLKKELRQSQRASVLMYRKAGERCDQIEQHINMRYKPEQELPPDLLEAADGQEFFDGYEPRVIK